MRRAVVAKTPTTIQDGLEQESVNYENLLDVLEKHLENETVDKPFLIKNNIKIIL